MIAIVTDTVFLLCEDVVSIYINETFPADHDHSRSQQIKSHLKYLKACPTPPSDNRTFQVAIRYLPIGIKHGTSSEEHVFVDVIGSKEAKAIFACIVQEVREQKPDHLYLNQLVEKMLNVPQPAAAP